MKKTLTILGLFGLFLVQAQVGINNDNPEATLDIKSEVNTLKALKITNSAGNEMVTVINDGKVGIATDKPKRTLQVKGIVNISNDAVPYGDNFNLLVKNSTGEIAEFYYSGHTSFPRLHIKGAPNKILINTSFHTGGADLALGTNEYPNTILIKQEGNVGIGTANPTEKLEVSGAIKVGSNSAAAGSAPNHPSEEGTIIYHNGSFYGRTSSGWKKLHN